MRGGPCRLQRISDGDMEKTQWQKLHRSVRLGQMYGLHPRTPEELAKLAVTGIICGTTIKVQGGVQLAMEKVVPLECQDLDIAEAFVGFSKDILKVIIIVKPAFTTAFCSYRATKYLNEYFDAIKLIFKAGHCAGPFNAGTIVVLDCGVDPKENTPVACYG